MRDGGVARWWREVGWDMERITFLGTGDPLNEERAQTSLAMPVDRGETLLIDASSGTIILRQLKKAGIPLASIRHVVISHRHFDHVGGLAPLLVALTAMPASQVTVYATAPTTQALHELLLVTIPGVEDWLGARLRWCELVPEQPVCIGDLTLTPFEVEHGIECVGMRLVRGGKTLVFTADTRPCPNVATWAENADLLIHEVYSLDDAAKAAHFFGHSTAADAGAVARVADVRRLILTHFRASSFADPGALAAEAAAAFGHPVGVARDLETVEY